MQELLQEDVYANDGKEGNVAQMLVEKEVEANSEVANILLELGDVNKPMLIDEEPEEEYAAQQHQLQPDQLMLHYREKLIIAQQQLEPWLADCHVRYWEHFENEEQDFFEHQQHQEEENELEIEELLDEEVIDNKEYNNNEEEEQQHLLTMQQTYPLRLQPKPGTVNVAINLG
jgi:hypothetical protein